MVGLYSKRSPIIRVERDFQRLKCRQSDTFLAERRKKGGQSVLGGRVFLPVE